MPFVIEKGKISISIDNARIVVTGTPLNDRLYDFVGKKTSLDDRAYELERQESRMIMDGKAPDEIQREMCIRDSDFTGTTTSEMHYSIFQADAVRTINFINADILSLIHI